MIKKIHRFSNNQKSVGFRLDCCIMFLAISALFFSCFGQINARIPVTAKQQLQSVCGTPNVKIVFLCQNSLYFIDFSETTPQVRKANGVVSPFFPVISNDGRWVAYQTDNNAEGPSVNPAAGKVWLRELAADGTPVKVADTGYVPRFVQNTSVDTPEIIYSTSLVCPGRACYNGGLTIKKKIVNESPQASQVFFDKGSYYGGLSWDNRYLSTGWPGGQNTFMLDLQNASAGPRPIHTMHVRKDVTNADTFVAVGACNMSRSASRIFTNVMLFYDFSSSAINNAGCYHPILGTWKQHEKLFISRYDSEDMKVFDMPADRNLVPISNAQGTGEAIEKEWYNPEWSNHPYFAAACLSIDRLWLKNGNYEHTYNTESIYLVNLKDSLYVKLVESADTSYASVAQFNHPYAWVEVPAGFQEDNTWLKSTIWERAGLGVKYRFGAQKPPNGNSFLYSGNSPVRMVLYSALGRQAARVVSDKAANIEPQKLFGNMPPGVYYIEIKSAGMKPQLRQWVMEK